jgi:hypothetical protein
MLETKCDLAEISKDEICYALLCKRALFSLDDITCLIPPAVTNILQEYEDIFPVEIPPGQPHVRGIEDQINLIPCATLPNRAVYRANPKETKEIQRQVQNLLDRGYVHENLSHCDVPVLLVPISSRISHRITQSSRQLRLSVNRSGARLAISHPSTLQDIKGILTLVKEKTSLSRPRSEAGPDPSWKTPAEGRK